MERWFISRRSLVLQLNTISLRIVGRLLLFLQLFTNLLSWGLELFTIGGLVLNVDARLCLR